MADTRRVLTELFQGERRRLIQLVQRIVRSEAVAEDLVQETFLKLWGRRVNGDSTGLLYRTAHNLALDHLRAQKVRHRHAERSRVDDMALPPADRAAEVAEEWRQLAEVLEGLPPRTRRIFLLNRVDGETYAAIAAMLDVSTSTVEKDMMRAMRACRQWLESRDPD